ncbi:hypothetical protein PIB30_101469, partial [Stylosanthes scabra]|nr:hypothetical protein [Stylosanthes scabra]
PTVVILLSTARPSIGAVSIKPSIITVGTARPCCRYPTQLRNQLRRLRSQLGQATAATFIPPSSTFPPELHARCSLLQLPPFSTLPATVHCLLPLVSPRNLHPLCPLPHVCAFSIWFTHFLMVHPNPNPRNPHLPQPCSSPPLPSIAIAGAWRSIT